MKKFISFIFFSFLYFNTAYGEIITMACLKVGYNHDIKELAGGPVYKNVRSYDTATKQYVSTINSDYYLMSLKDLKDDKAEILLNGRKIANLVWEDNDLKEIAGGKLINSCTTVKRFTTGEEQVLTKKEDIKEIVIDNKSYKKEKKFNKKFVKYMKTPEMELCIDYINNYGWFANQEARLLAITTRGIDCSQYNDAAYYEDQRRTKELVEAGKDLFNSAVDAKYGVVSDGAKKSRTHCTTTNIGGVVQIFCREQ